MQVCTRFTSSSKQE